MSERQTLYPLCHLSAFTVLNEMDYIFLGRHFLGGHLLCTGNFQLYSHAEWSFLYPGASISISI